MNELIIALIPLLCQIESSNNPDAKGDYVNGKPQAIGILQIHKSYWKDGCDYMFADWEYKLAKRADMSKDVAKAYLLKYGRSYEKKTGKKATMEVLAAIHCSGPDGWKKMNKPGVKKYIEKVRKLKELS